MTHGVHPQLASLLVPLVDLHPDPRNARKHGEASIRAVMDSYAAHGQRKPIVCQQRAGRLVVRAGNGQLEAARRLGWTHVAALVVDEPDGAATAYALRDNRSAELSTWDADVLRDELVVLRDEGGPLPAALGWEDFALDEEQEDDDVPEDDEVPAPVDRGVVDGDVFLLGTHVLVCGDSHRDEVIDHGLAVANVEIAQCVITDPPYAIYGSSTGLAADIADDKMVRPFFDVTWKQVFRVLDKWAHAYMFCDWRSCSAVWDGARRAGLAPKNLLVWDKGGGGLGSSYANCHELVAFFAKLPTTGTMRNGRETGQRQVHRPNILRYSKPHGDERLHNAAKPVVLLRELVRNSSDAGELVVDLFGGSGSTLIAAEHEKRRCLIVEVEPAACAIIMTRWERLTGGVATKHAAVAH